MTDCVRKILAEHVTVDQESAGTHEQVFKLALYFANLGTPLESALQSCKAYFENRVSQRYPDVKGHFIESFEDISENPDYTFSCWAMRSIVENPQCNLCPFNKHPGFNADDTFFNVSLFDMKYRQSHMAKRGKELQIVSKNLTNFTFEPTAVGISRECYKHPERGQKWSLIRGNVCKSGEHPVEVVLPKDKMNTLKDIHEVLQKGTDYAISFISNALDASAGVKEIIMKQMEGLPHLIDGEKTQGLYKFKDKWYWADASGTRDQDWQPSNNIILDTQNIDKSSAIHLSRYEQLPSKALVADVVKAVQEINAPETIYPLLSYVAMTLFTQRFKHLAKENRTENLANIPCLYAEGLAESGKSETINGVIRQIAGFGHDMEQITGKSLYILHTQLLNASNSIPVFLDEVKQELLTGDNKTEVGASDLKAIVRNSWDNTTFMRGDYNAETGARKYDNDAPVFFSGPSLPDCFDTAMRDRIVLVSVVKERSMAHQKQWVEFNKLIESTDALPQIGLLFLKVALTLPDSAILKLHSDARRVIEKYAQGGYLSSRRLEGLTKLIFGALLWKNFWGSDFKYETCVKALLKTYDIVDDHMDFSQGKINGDMAAIHHLRRIDDWDQWLIDILVLFSPKTNPQYNLAKDQDFWFRDETNHRVLYVDLARATECVKRYKRSINEKVITLNERQITTSGVAKGFLLPFQDGTYTKNGVLSPTNRLFPGPFLKFNVNKLVDPGSHLQHRFILDGIPGYDNLLTKRPSETPSELRPWENF